MQCLCEKPESSMCVNGKKERKKALCRISSQEGRWKRDNRGERERYEKEREREKEILEGELKI